MLKICIYTTNRAEYSKLRPIMKLLKSDPNIKMQLLITGSHLLKEYGESKNQIIRDGFTITEEVYSTIAGDDITKTVETIGIALLKLPSILKRLDPDIILCGFDRFDMFPFAIAASLMNICLVHIEGGEITGTLDEKIRHAITKLSNYHLVSTEDAKQNLIKMGEFENKVFVTGCPRYDELLNINIEFEDKVMVNFNIKNKKFIIVCYHPVSTDIDLSFKRWKIILDTLFVCKEEIILIKPNIDYGNEILNNYTRMKNIEKQENIRMYSHIDIDEFSILLKNCNCLIGNSSAGIREACVYGTPVINIGTRQQYRIHKNLENITTLIDFTEKELSDKINNLSNIRYKKNLVFGDGKAAHKIVDILKTIDNQKTAKILSYAT